MWKRGDNRVISLPQTVTLHISLGILHPLYLYLTCIPWQVTTRLDRGNQAVCWERGTSLISKPNKGSEVPVGACRWSCLRFSRILLSPVLSVFPPKIYNKIYILCPQFPYLFVFFLYETLKKEGLDCTKLLSCLHGNQL